jgi:hypothetical protein
MPGSANAVMTTLNRGLDTSTTEIYGVDARVISHNDAEALAFFERAGPAFRLKADVRMVHEIDSIAEITEHCGLTINFASVP